MTNEDLEEFCAPIESKAKTIQVKVPGTAAILVYDMETHREDFETASKANAMSAALFEVRQKVFRPARKHGYSDPRLTKFEETNPDFTEIIGILEEMYTEVLNEYGVSDFS